MYRPILLLDVDGVISLFGFDHGRPPNGRYALVDGTMHFLSATAAALIAELARTFVAGGYRMRALVQAIVTSPRYRDANDRRRP